MRCLVTADIAKQLLGKHVPAAKNKHATMEYFWTTAMEMEFSVVRAEML
jgi:hypothetical protein